MAGRTRTAASRGADMSVREILETTRYEGQIGFDVIERSADRVVAEMPVTAGILNPFGTVHAGAMIWFADVAATYCAIGDAEIGDDGKGFPLAVDLHTVLMGNQGDGVLTAVAVPVKRGRSLIVVRTVVTGKDGRTLIEMTTSHIPAG